MTLLEPIAVKPYEHESFADGICAEVAEKLALGPINHRLEHLRFVLEVHHKERPYPKRGEVNGLAYWEAVNALRVLLDDIAGCTACLSCVCDAQDTAKGIWDADREWEDKCND